MFFTDYFVQYELWKTGLAGSDEERRAVKKSFRYSARREYEVYDIAEPDVKFELETPESVEIGNNFDLKVGFILHSSGGLVFNVK